ncbi:DNA adenine methylase [Senegalia massiliensis]|uniref:DNA adenine methylase n=1 Tax=Senegalia massiliensis TaxID=1720316 RepID=UPI0010303B93|nr:DNA adenine methylase [Senegalia massiliensis]
MQPFVKWPGGKQEELKVIIPNLPKKIDRYIEPFVGGGAVYLDINSAKEYYINDKSNELINLYKCIKNQDQEFFNKIEAINHNWLLLEEIVKKNEKELIEKYIEFRNNQLSDLDFKDFVISFIIKHNKELNGLLETSFNINLKNFLNELERNLKNKTKRMKKIEKEKGELSQKDILDNYEAAFKSGFYMHFRHLYNNINVYKINSSFETAIFYFIREYCYSSMFRYNKKGNFNVPYGGISYNRKDFKSKINKLRYSQLIKHLNKTQIENLDFEEFLNKIEPTTKDFIFLDPPYDSDFSTYAQNKFEHNDQERLADYLKKTQAKFMVIIKNTDFIYSLYKEFYIKPFDKKYLVSFQNRNDKNAEHLIITNYKTIK